MTISTALLLTGLLALAALCGLIGVVLFRRYRPFLPDQPREAETEPPSVPAATPAHDGAGETVVLPMVRPEAGADMDFGDELAAMRADMEAAPDAPLDPVAAERAQEFDHACRLAEQRYAACAARIDLALTVFAARHGIELPEHVEPAPSIEIALVHLRYGVREPVAATRTFNAITGEWPVLTDEGLHRWMAGDYASAEAL